MKLSSLFGTAKKQPIYQTNRQLNELTRQNYRFKNLNSQNRALVMDLINKHTDKIRDGRGISSTVLQREGYKLYQNREKMGLTLNDLADIKEILNMFKK